MAGDVQGNTTNVISNQQGADINHDGNDEKILIEEGAENKTDELEQIKLISFAEYNALSDEDKAKYVKYNPSLQSMAYSEWLSIQNQAIAGFNSIGPAIEKIQVLEKLRPVVENIEEPIKPVAEVFNSATSVINSLTSVPIIGQLAAPVFDAILAIGEMVGFIYAMVNNPINMAKAYKDAYDSIDLSKYKTVFEGSEETPNIEEMLNEKENEMLKVEIPDKEIRTLYENQKAELKSQIESVKQPIQEAYEAGKNTLNTAKTAMDGIDLAIGTFSVGTATAAKKMFELSYEAAKEKFTQDYTEDSRKLANKINGFESKIPVKYIKSTDLDKIKTQQKTVDKPADIPSTTPSNS
jgi:hypothetical protein